MNCVATGQFRYTENSILAMRLGGLKQKKTHSISVSLRAKLEFKHQNWPIHIF